MNDEQFVFAKTIMTRIVMEKIPEAKRWSVSKEFKSWIDSLSKEQFQVYLDRLRLLTRTLSDQESARSGGLKGDRYVHLFWILPARRKPEDGAARSDRRGGHCVFRFGLLEKSST